MTHSATSDSASLLFLTSFKFIFLNHKCNIVIFRGVSTYAALKGLLYFARYRCYNGFYQDVLLQRQGNNLDCHIGRTLQVLLGEGADVGAWKKWHKSSGLCQQKCSSAFAWSWALIPNKYCVVGSIMSCCPPAVMILTLFFYLLWSGFTVICWARDAVNYLVRRFIAFVANTNQVHSPFQSCVAVCTVSTDMAGNLLFLMHVSQSTVFVLSADWIFQVILS